MQKLEDDRLKNKNFIDAWKKAFNGIWYAIKTQRNVKIQLSIAVVIIAICIIAKPSKVDEYSNRSNGRLSNKGISSNGKNSKRCCGRSSCTCSNKCSNSSNINYIYVKIEEKGK